MIRAYHFVGNTLRDGSPIPADGEWLHVKRPIKICEKGLHASLHVADALKFAPGNILCLVDMSRDIAKQSDKLVARCRRIVARFDATDLLRANTRASALSVAHLWDMPAVVQQYLETGDETLRQQARDAARDARDAAYAAYAAARDADAAYATYAAAHVAAYAAARDARDARDAAAVADAAAHAAGSRKAPRKRLQDAVNAKFKEILE